MSSRMLLLAFVTLLLAPVVSYTQNSPSSQLPVSPQRDRATFQSPPNKPKYAPNRILVRFRPETPKLQTEAAHAAIAAQVIRTSKLVRGLDIVRLPEKMTVDAALRAYAQDPTVLYAEPDFAVHVQQNPVAPNDPRFAELWGLQNAPTGVNAPRAWGLSVGSPNVVVGVIDTGIDYNHEDLNANMFRNPLDCNGNGVDDDGNGFVDDCYGVDVANGDSDPMDDHGHGTHVAGTIGAAGNNGIGVVGVNWQVKLIACKFLNAYGGGYTSGAIGCLDYIASMKDRGVNIVATNNSWGGDSFSQALLDAIDSHRQRGILFIAAAGNAGANSDVNSFYPADFDLPNVIAVASTTSWDTLSSFSNYGRYSVHVAAPGTDIVSTTPGNTYSLFSGTSMAAPHVTGVAALLAAQDPSRDWKAIKNLILAGGDTKTFLADTISQKRLSAYGALTCSNSIVRARLLPRDDNLYVTVGEPLVLAALNIDCARPNGTFSVLVDGGAAAIPLLDDGQGNDQEANDGIYSGQHAWSLAEVGAHTLTFSTGDTVTVNVIPPLSPYTFSTAIPFSYRGITGTQVPHMGGADVQLGQITPPFPIRFGGVDFSSLYVVGAGYVIFGSPLVAPYLNVPLPAPRTRTMVAPFWDDLWPNANIYWDVIGAAPNRELVIEWRGVDHSDSAPFFGACGSVPPSGITFEIVFFEGSSNILFNYLDVTFGPYTPNDPVNCDVPNVLIDQGLSATVGVQVEPGLATQFSFNTPSLIENSSILWKIGRPTPTVTDIAPFTASAGGPAFKLRVTGTGFLDGSVVHWNGSDRPTTFVNSTELSASIFDADIASPATASVTVLNRPPDGEGESAPATLTIFSAYPTPVLTSITPDSVIAGGGMDQMFTLTGTNFVSASVARWNGSNRPTSIISSTQLRFSVSAADIGLGGTVPVTVFTPTPGGGTSNTLTANVTNPAPTLASINPVNIGAGGPAFTLQVVGTGLAPASVVRWNGKDRPTVFVGSNSVNASIPATDIAVPGNAQVSVFNPAPGGGPSNSQTFEIVTPPPNDNFANATVISLYPFTQTEDTRGASTEPTDPTSCGASPHKTVWYRFTPPAPGIVVSVDTVGSNYGSILSAWTGSLGSFTQLGCAYAYNSLRVVASGTTPIYFMVDGGADYNPAGVLIFNLNVNVPAPAVTLSPNSLTFAPQIVGTTSATQTATLTNSGNAPLTISKIMMPLQAFGYFGTSKNCIANFNPGESCTIEVWTHPLERGSYTGAVILEDNAFGSPHFITLSGIGTDFSISPAPGSATSASVNAGQAATYSLSLAGTFEFNGSVGLSCLGAPSAASCNLAPPALNVNGTIPVAATVNITTTARAVLPPLGGPPRVQPQPPAIPFAVLTLLVLAALLIFGLGLRTRRFALRVPTFALVTIIGLLLLSSCGGGGNSSYQPPPPPPPAGTAAGTYTIKVTATSGGVSRDMSLTLTVR
ncbi:MAG TPA: S8 family serine peptidase [Candidatus Angelobacter sp.]|nr:S8 family serine peptidase [Candidatus Angelobacter sp.]